MTALTNVASSVSRHSLDIDRLTHAYGGFLAVDDVTLSVRPGEIIALLGPSGCGKTTLLRAVAGFLKQTSGSVLVDGKPIDHLPPGGRNIGIVFQNYALFPHLTVTQNVAYGLEARRTPRNEVRARVAECLDVVQMGHLADRLPRQLSGGQQQRVALARALAIAPSILLLDEPFAALDKNLRFDMQLEIKRLQRRFGLTAILVTHDQEEAMSMADRIAVMQNGRVEQFDDPATIYDFPETLFINNFIGSSNIFPGKVVEAQPGSLRIELDAGAVFDVPTQKPMATGSRIVLSARPEQLTLRSSPAASSWPVRLRMSLPLGPTVIHDVEGPGGVAIKVAAPRQAGSASSFGSELYCGLADGVRPSVFLEPNA